MKRRGLWAACVVLLVGVGVLVIGTAYAKDEAAGAQCSKATLDGKYVFAENGVGITGNDQVPFALAGYQMYNGNGRVRGVYSGNFGGEVVRKVPFSGTYTITADCIATATYTDGGQFDQFVAPDGSLFTFVQTRPSDAVTAGFEVRGTAKRVAQ